MDNRAKRILQGIIYVSVFIIGLCGGIFLCFGISIWRDRRNTAQPESVTAENKEVVMLPDTGNVTPEETEIVVDYPFSYGEKGWSLVLRKSGGEDVQNEEAKGEAADKGSARRSFCLYDENGQLLQEFPCGIVSAEVIFRYDVLFDYYKDMIVYPADAPESGAEGLCYQWEREKQRFAEVPVTIPWYQEGSVRNEAFLADHGFAGSEAFYEYRDRFGNLIMEIYFDQQAGRGCGIRYYYSFNDKLKKRATRDGFAFEEVETGVWEPQEEFSKLTVYGDDVSKSASGYKEIYKYTDDGKISSFEARGMDLVDKVPMEVSLLSLDYIYRDDGTLYHREYHHYPKFFSSAGQSEDGDYDKQGRLVYRYSYITHGAMDEYYLYDGNHKEPKYRLFLDWGASNYAYVRMIAYDSAD